jgi:hypothetical protein
MFGGRVFQQTVGISISYAGYKLCSSSRRLVPLISSNSSYYHWVDVTAGGHFVPEDNIRPVAIKLSTLTILFYETQLYQTPLICPLA